MAARDKRGVQRRISMKVALHEAVADSGRAGISSGGSWGWHAARAPNISVAENNFFIIEPPSSNGVL